MVNKNGENSIHFKKATSKLLSQVTQEFCESTSLHGYSYIVNGDSIVVKLIWVIAIICFTAIGTLFVVVNTEDYLNSRLVTSIESSTATLEVSKQIFICYECMY